MITSIAMGALVGIFPFGIGALVGAGVGAVTGIGAADAAGIRALINGAEGRVKEG